MSLTDADGISVATSVASAESWWLPEPEQGWATILLSPSNSPCTAFSVGTHTLPPGGSLPRFCHARGDLVWLVLSGRGVATLGDETTPVAAGSTVVAGRKVVHSIHNEGEEDLALLWVSVPCGHENVLRTHGRSRDPGQPRGDNDGAGDAKSWDFFTGPEALGVHHGERGPAFVVSPEERARYWQSIPTTGHADVIVSPYNHPSNAFAIGSQTLDPGAFIPPHSHTRNEELLFVAEGRGVCNLDAGARPIETGDVLYVSQNCKHDLRAAEDAPLSVIWVMSPPGLEPVLAGLGRPRLPGEAQPDPFPPPPTVLEILSEGGFAPLSPGD